MAIVDDGYTADFALQPYFELGEMSCICNPTGPIPNMPADELAAPRAVSHSQGGRQGMPRGSVGAAEHRRRRRPSIDLAERVAWHGINDQQPLRRLVIRELPPGIAQNVGKRGVTHAV